MSSSDRKKRSPARRRHHGRTKAGTHVPVMVREVLRYLSPRSGDTVADCTVGYGGHAHRFCPRIGSAGRLIGLDVDAAQLPLTRERLADADCPVSLHHASYTALPEVLAAEGVDGCDVILADLGVSSMQIDDPDRGVSYKHEDAPLDMRMDPTAAVTAADVLATISVEKLSEALADLADEEDNQRIAEWIVQQRDIAPLTRTSQLVRLVFHAKGLSKRTWRNDPSTRYGQLHPAAKTFQALRILVNDEMANVRRLLEIVPACLRPGGRVGIISFHSGEDRLVKRAFKTGYADGVYERTSEKVLTPRAAEVRSNPRSASAKFRWAVKAADESAGR